MTSRWKSLLQPKVTNVWGFFKTWLIFSLSEYSLGPKQNVTKFRLIIKNKLFILFHDSFLKSDWHDILSSRHYQVEQNCSSTYYLTDHSFII